MGPAVIDFSVAVAGALMAWAVAILAGLPEAVQVALSAIIAVGGGLAAVPFAHSFWTLFLYISGEGASRESRP
jgi:hypothetical protein